MPAGRPTDYNLDLTSIICARLAEGESLRAICRDPDMPGLSTVFKWLGQHSEFVEQYAKAREEQADTMADEIVAIADEGETKVVVGADGTSFVAYDSTAVARNRLRVDARKWVASKLKPRAYGDRLDLNHGGKVEVGFQLNINRGKKPE